MCVQKARLARSNKKPLHDLFLAFLLIPWLEGMAFCNLLEVQWESIRLKYRLGALSALPKIPEMKDASLFVI